MVSKKFLIFIKKQLRSDRFLLARLFLRSKKTVRKKCIAYLIHVPKMHKFFTESNKMKIKAFLLTRRVKTYVLTA